MLNRKELTPLGQYIDELCKRQRFSYREASRMAGLDETTISQILRRGKTSTPRPDTLRLIADALGGSYDKMLVLAGHLPEPAATDDAELDRLARELRQRWQRIKANNPAAMEEYERLVIIQADAFETATSAATSLMEEENEIAKPE